MKKNGTKNLNFDDCHLVAGSGDKGRDIIFVQGGKTIGVVQCKKYKTLITKPQAVKEILKFVLNALQQPRVFDFNNLTYIFAVSSGFNSIASDLLEHFSLEIEHESNLRNWIREVKTEFKGTNLTPSIEFNHILTALKQIKVQKLLPYDIGELMDDGIIGNFFMVDKVIDVKAFKSILDKPKFGLTDFMNQYRKSQQNNLSRINFFGLALTTKPREIPFEKLFVKPTLIKRGHKNSNQYFSSIIETYNEYEIKNSSKITDYKNFNLGIFGLETEYIKTFLEKMDLQKKNLYEPFFYENSKMKTITIDVEEIFQTSKNVVLLGKPGAGKSSLVKYFMLHILSGTYQRVGIPLRVELHRYNQERKRNALGFLDYILNQLRSEHQIPNLFMDNIVELLNIHKVVIFFDGMDEVMDVQERINVRNDIENIANKYENLKCVVTSRFESYDEVNFNEQQFEVFEINDFDDQQLEAYVNKWYEIEESNTEVRLKEVSACLEELYNIEDELKRNPLLLTLILILYRNELEIPTSKLDIYEGCTLTLVDTRDNKEKKLATELSISNKIATFSSLAYWQYNKLIEKNQTPITYNLAHLHVRNYLIGKGEIEFEHEADEVAKSFLEFAFIRSIYVENSFTHKTFLEYFTAYNVYSNFFSKGKLEQLYQFIEVNIISSSWHVVLELLICKIDKAQGDFTIIDEIVERQLSTEKLEVVVFFLSILKYLQNISPRMINRLLNLSFTITIQDINKNRAMGRSINSHLIDLSKNERFSAKLTKSLDEYEMEIPSKYQYHSYIVFILETGIITSRYVLIMTDEGVRENAMKETPYIFTLLAVTQITDEEEYGRLLTSYITTFDEKALAITHKTRYGSNIFFGQNSFHWITTFLFSKDYERFDKSVSILMKNGINKMKILRSIKRGDNQTQIPYETLLSFLDSTSSEARKEIVLAALRKYYGYKQRTDKEKKSFYRNISSAKRKFHIPE